MSYPNANFTAAVTTQSERESLKRSNGLFLLKMKETRQISQPAIDDIIEGCRELVFRRSQEIKRVVWSTLSASGIDPDSVSGLTSVFDDEFDPFLGIETQYKQEKFFREEFGLLVSVSNSPPPHTIPTLHIACDYCGGSLERN